MRKTDANCVHFNSGEKYVDENEVNSAKSCGNNYFYNCAKYLIFSETFRHAVETEIYIYD